MKKRGLNSIVGVGGGNSHQRRLRERHPEVPGPDNRFGKVYWPHRQDRLGREAARRDAAILKRAEAAKLAAERAVKPKQPLQVKFIRRDTEAVASEAVPIVTPTMFARMRDLMLEFLGFDGRRTKTAMADAGA